MPQCNAFTASDTRCRMATLKDSSFCMNHNPDYAEKQQDNVRTASQAAIRARRMAPIKFPPQATFRTRAGLQLLLDATYRLLLAGELPEERARLLLRSLGLAVRNFERPANAEHDWSPDALDGGLEDVMFEAIDSSVQHRRYERAERVAGERMAREQKAIDLERWPVLKPVHHTERADDRRRSGPLPEGVRYDPEPWSKLAEDDAARI